MGERAYCTARGELSASGLGGEKAIFSTCSVVPPMWTEDLHGTVTGVTYASGAQMLPQAA